MFEMNSNVILGYDNLYQSIDFIQKRGLGKSGFPSERKGQNGTELSAM